LINDCGGKSSSEIKRRAEILTFYHEGSRTDWKGRKRWAYEIAEQFDWQIADVYFILQVVDRLEWDMESF